MIPAPQEQIEFLQQLQRILEEGNFTSTYKYALLVILADIAVEFGDDSGDSLEISLDTIAERYIRYYWQQARPYPGTKGNENQVLKQSTGRQAIIVTYVARHQHSTVDKLRRDQRVWKQLVRATQRTVLEQPLWKLQRVGGQVLDCLFYQREEDYRELAEGRARIDKITLKPGAAYCLRRFRALVFDLATGAWVRFVRQLPANRPMLGNSSDLADFLFGMERRSNAKVGEIIRDVQNGVCFYCAVNVSGRGQLDHFVPRSRYSIDLGHNFVFADESCNNRKRDRLAAEPHLERWVRRNENCRVELEQRFNEAGATHDAGASFQVARWAYGQAESAGSLVWMHGDELVHLTGDWKEILRSR